MKNLTQSELVYWTNKINGAYDTNELDSIVLSIKPFKHPYIHHLMGFSYFVKEDRESARTHLLECVKLSLDNYSTIKNTFFIDSLGSSLLLLIRIDKHKLAANSNLWLKYFVTSYYSFSLAISHLNIAFDTYRNRALLLQDSEDVLPKFLTKHVGTSTIFQGLVMSDFYSSYKDATKVGAVDLANKSLNSMREMLHDFGDLNILGTNLGDWDLDELNVLIKQKHAQMFKSLTGEYRDLYHLSKNDLIL